MESLKNIEARRPVAVPEVQHGQHDALLGLMYQAGVSRSVAEKCIVDIPGAITPVVTASGMELIAEGSQHVIAGLGIEQSELDRLHTALVYVKTSETVEPASVVKMLSELINARHVSHASTPHADAATIIRHALPDLICQNGLHDYVLVLQGIRVAGEDEETAEESEQQVAEKITALLLDRIDRTEGATEYIECISIGTTIHAAAEFGMDAARADMMCQNALVTENRQLRKLLHTDRLLAMPNRAAADDFVRRIGQSVSTMDAHVPDYVDHTKLGEYQTVVAFIDLNRFKGFQDAHGGHEFGNLYLANIRDGLNAAMKEVFPKGMVWRQSGDEFGVIIPFALHMQDDVNAYLSELNHVLRTSMHEAYKSAVKNGVYEAVSPTPKERLMDLGPLLFPEDRYKGMALEDLLYSIGYSVQFMPLNEAELKDMWTQADAAMYGQKKQLFPGNSSRVAERAVSDRRTVIRIGSTSIDGTRRGSKGFYVPRFRQS